MIQLTKDLALTADDHCYIVGKPRQKAGNGLVIDDPTYYSTADQAVQGALCRAMRISVKEGSVTTLREFVERQEQLLAELQRLIAPLNTGNSRQSPVGTPAPVSQGSYIPQAQEDEEEASRP